MRIRVPTVISTIATGSTDSSPMVRCSS
ncbi:hypothetical protein [Blastomonas sp.]